MPASRFVWYELLTPDVAGAAAFYSGVVGWQAQDSGPDQVPGDTWVLHGRDPQGASFALLSMRK